MTSAPGSLAANRFPSYVDLVRRQLARDYPADALQGAGLSVMTRDVAVGAGLRRRRGDAGRCKALDSKKRPPLQAGVVVTDVHDGEVRAVVGSREFIEHGFNRAVEAQRPVGSLLKPFVYLLALAQPQQVVAGQLGRRFAGHDRARQRQALDARQFRRPQPRHACA